MVSLQDVAMQLTNENNAIVLGNYLDDIRREFKDDLLTPSYFDKEPSFPEDLEIKHQAYFVAMNHRLCSEFGYEAPMWVYSEEYILEKPYFAMNAKGMLRIILLAESPFEFRARNIFVSSSSMIRV